ncbi:hypothetical protein [Aquipuribacter hungaricus]|uniref:hypothetical protein n=1 Tax=Aquipuribacter hungaricus TaxID=545624 RepID=UPI00361C5930
MTTTSGNTTPPTTPPTTSARLDTDRIEVAARALLDDKITAVRGLAAARQAREDARAGLAAAERHDAAAYTAALRAGWTTDELKRVGLDAPTSRAPGRPRGTQHRTPAAGHSTGQSTGQSRGPSAEQEPGPDAGQDTGPAGRSAPAASSTGPGSSAADSPTG